MVFFCLSTLPQLFASQGLKAFERPFFGGAGVDGCRCAEHLLNLLSVCVEPPAQEGGGGNCQRQQHPAEYLPESVGYLFDGSDVLDFNRGGVDFHIGDYQRQRILLAQHHIVHAGFEACQHRLLRVACRVESLAQRHDAVPAQQVGRGVGPGVCHRQHRLVAQRDGVGAEAGRGLAVGNVGK